LALHTLEISHYLITVLVSLRPDFLGRPALAFSGTGHVARFDVEDAKRSPSSARKLFKQEALGAAAPVGTSVRPSRDAST
ncbi:hypothetical protein, partial [Phenylobacterium sp.]|uniref:hypothetical protein n=1 Tax=Phenylobacterium sp. TaxID=1871053 RepID=UPI002E36F095